MGFAMGILATRGVNRPATPRDPFPGRTRTFQEMSRVARKQGVEIVVFSPRGVDKRRSRVLGWSFVPGRGWGQSYHPLPPVVYNRVANRRAEGRARVQNLLSWLKARGVIVFNPRFLDKWEVYEALQADPAVKQNVPETLLYTDPGQALDALRRWGVVFCKPRRGSLGTGIAALKLIRPGRVSISRNGVKAGTRVLQVSSPRGVHHWVEQYLRPYRYCLQKGVDLATVQGCRFDIRTLVQKDEHGLWRFTGAAARVAGRGQLTTHVPRGGRRMPLRTALRYALREPQKAEEKMRELAELAQAAAACLERHYGELYGEFSLDVGLDSDARLWILEANAKPFRFDEADIRRRGFERLIAFARYLAEGAAQNAD
ncbi:MAG: YheC/YheD family protein [Limnochordia bacterium]|jgi:hypothetical protein